MLRNVPRGVWMLGLVSLFMDVSSEMIHAVLPLFVVGTLGASAALLGLLEGIAEATAQISKLFSGLLSDRWRNRKHLAVLGYGLAAAVKPLFPLAESVTAVFAARFLDRVGKGIRGAPRDAMVADMTAEAQRGAAFGLRQSLDTVGAFAGPLIAIGLMSLLAMDVRMVMWMSIVPALICVLILLVAVKEPRRLPAGGRKPGFDIRTARQLGGRFWYVAMLGGVMMLARFSEAFLVLKASDAGFSIAWVPLVMVVMSGVYSLASYPAGVLSDRFGRRGLLGAGLLVLLAADLVLAYGGTVPAVLVGVGLWGLHMGLTQGILAALVADTAPPPLRGTAFGMFNVVGGVAALSASVIAGLMWEAFGPSATFLAGAAFAVLTILGLAGVKARQNGHAQG